MELDIELYNIFVSVASDGRVSKASDELSVTQSAVSQSILKLEKIFDKELFIRSRQGVTLTSFGKQLYDNVKSQVNDLRLAYEKMNNMVASKNIIKVGASDIIFENLILKIIKKHFSSEHFYI